MGSDVGKMVAVGLVWGATNAFMRRGALLWDQKLRYPSSPAATATAPRQRCVPLLGYLKKWVDLVLIWQYSVPFLINLSASAAFFYILGGSPISLAVPVTNGTTFAATAVTAVILGEEVRAGRTIVGTGLIVLGVWLCVS